MTDEETARRRHGNVMNRQFPASCASFESWFESQLSSAGSIVRNTKHSATELALLARGHMAPRRRGSPIVSELQQTVTPRFDPRFKSLEDLNEAILNLGRACSLSDVPRDWRLLRRVLPT